MFLIGVPPKSLQRSSHSVMDPPYLYKVPFRHHGVTFPCLSYERLTLLPIPSIADENGCILLMWIAGTYLDDCL